MRFNFLIAVKDKEPVMSINDVRHRQGDIIVAKPFDMPLGRLTIAQCLCVPVNLADWIDEPDWSMMVIKRDVYDWLIEVGLAWRVVTVDSRCGFKDDMTPEEQSAVLSSVFADYTFEDVKNTARGFWKQNEWDETRRHYCKRLYENGLTEDEDFREIDYETDGVSYGSYPPAEWVWSIKEGEPIRRPKLLAKFRYKIPHSRFDRYEVDSAKIEDDTYIYQPFLALSRVVEPFFDARSDYQPVSKGNSAYLRKKAEAGSTKVASGDFIVDTETPAIASVQDKIFDWSSSNQLVVDKLTNTFVNPQKEMPVGNE